MKKEMLTNSECFALCDEFVAETGKSDENWEELLAWIEKRKGLETRQKFEERTKYPM